jgi:hypothetical protein
MNLGDRLVSIVGIRDGYDEYGSYKYLLLPPINVEIVEIKEGKYQYFKYGVLPISSTTNKIDYRYPITYLPEKYLVNQKGK